MISGGIVRSVIVSFVTLLVAAGCASTPYQQSLDSRDETIPLQGSLLVLEQPLELRAGAARVFLQDGRVTRYQDRNRFEPVCSFGLRRQGDEPLIDTIEPDRFNTGTARNRIQARAQPMSGILVASRSSHALGGLLVNSRERGGGPGHLTFIIEIPLQSESQPQVDNLHCAVDRPVYWRGRIGVGDIRAALGDIALIRAPGDEQTN